MSFTTNDHDDTVTDEIKEVDKLFQEFFHSVHLPKSEKKKRMEWNLLHVFISSYIYVHRSSACSWLNVRVGGGGQNCRAENGMTVVKRSQNGRGKMSSKRMNLRMMAAAADFPFFGGTRLKKGRWKRRKISFQRAKERDERSLLPRVGREKNQAHDYNNFFFHF